VGEESNGAVAATLHSPTTGEDSFTLDEVEGLLDKSTSLAVVLLLALIVFLGELWGVVRLRWDFLKASGFKTVYSSTSNSSSSSDSDSTSPNEFVSFLILVRPE
jgi:hypothetical protein